MHKCISMLRYMNIFMSEIVKYRIAKSTICQYVLQPEAGRDYIGSLTAATNEFIFQCEKVLGEKLNKEESARYMISSFCELGVNPWVGKDFENEKED